MTVAGIAEGSEEASPRVPIFESQTGQVILMDRIEQSDAEWRKRLTPEQYRVTRQRGTERAFSGAYHNHHGNGVYRCVCCGIDLYPSTTKFDSGTGWPSFWAPISELNVRHHTETNWFMQRTEIRCAGCGAHLGHAFDDGPPPTGKRHCINAVALTFREAMP